MVNGVYIIIAGKRLKINRILSGKQGRRALKITNTPDGNTSRKVVNKRKHQNVELMYCFCFQLNGLSAILRCFVGAS